MGPCAGGAVYSPALTDFIYMVKNTSNMFITGPKVIKSVTMEEVTAEDLGGAVAHNTISGVAHFACENETDCIEQIKYLLDFLPSNNMEEAPVYDSSDDPGRMDESLDSIIPDSDNVAYDMVDVIKSCVDNGEIYQVLENYAMNMITCFARFDGQSVGIIANQPKFLAGCLDINASDKLPASSASAMPSISLSLPSWTYQDSCRASIRNTAASSATVPNCSTHTAKRRFPK